MSIRISSVLFVSRKFLSTSVRNNFSAKRFEFSSVKNFCRQEKRIFVRSIFFLRKSFRCREVSLFIKSKKLRDFDEINLKNYLQSLDENLDSKSEVNGSIRVWKSSNRTIVVSRIDFHNLFLVFNYFIDGQHGLFHCNNSRPLVEEILLFLFDFCVSCHVTFDLFSIYRD